MPYCLGQSNVSFIGRWALDPLPEASKLGLDRIAKQKRLEKEMSGEGWGVCTGPVLAFAESVWFLKLVPLHQVWKALGLAMVGHFRSSDPIRRCVPHRWFRLIVRRGCGAKLAANLRFGKQPSNEPRPQNLG